MSDCPRCWLAALPPRERREAAEILGLPVPPAGSISLEAPPVGEFFTIPELEALGVPRSAVRRLVDAGSIRATRPGKAFHLNAGDVRRELFAESAEPARAEPEPSEWARDRVRQLLG